MPTKRSATAVDTSSFWMIRRKDGLFSKGKTCPIFGKGGKMWETHGKLIGHLKTVNRYHEAHGARRRFPHPYRDCEVVQFRRVEEAKSDVMGYGE